MIINGHEIAGRMPLFQPWGRDAIRAGTKTQTRRTKGLERVNENPDQCTEIINIGGGQFQAWLETSYPPSEGHYIDEPFKCPYKPGEVRVMREPLLRSARGNAIYSDSINMRDMMVINFNGFPVRWRWKLDTLNHMFMPTKYGRTFCQIEDIKAERLQDISDDDIVSEGGNGIMTAGEDDQFLWFRNIWDEINGPGAWDRNDWVFVPSWKTI